MIDAVDDRRIDIFTARRGDHDLAGAACQMQARLRLAREQPRALEHEFYAKRAPGELRRIAFGEHLDAIAVHHHRIAVDGDFARKFPVRGVVAREVRVGLRIAKVVERNDLDILLPLRLVECAQDIAADAAVAIDPDFDRHR